MTPLPYPSKKNVFRRREKRIAQKLFELTDLSLKQISEIVGLSKSKLKKLFHLQERGTAKYKISRSESPMEQLFRQIDTGLTDMKKQNEEL